MHLTGFHGAEAGAQLPRAAQAAAGAADAAGGAGEADAAGADCPDDRPSSFQAPFLLSLFPGEGPHVHGGVRVQILFASKDTAG